MKEPDRDKRAARDEQGVRPDFEALAPSVELVRGERTRDDFLDAVMSLDQPATADEVADRADHGVDAAREYLDWFKRMGIVRQVTETPATYERNREYLRWRQVQQLRTDFTSDELVGFLESATERDREFADEFGVESPDSVSIATVAENTGRSIESVWQDVADWKTTRRRIELLERALVGETNDAVDGRMAA